MRLDGLELFLSYAISRGDIWRYIQLSGGIKGKEVDEGESGLGCVSAESTPVKQTRRPGSG